MEQRRTYTSLRIAATVGCLVGIMQNAFAAPPQNSAPRTRLDLTLPSLENAVKSVFPSARSHTLGAESENRSSLALGADAWQDRPSERIANLASRVHREGLPVARLWENRSALVSLGLNQRGKPGLWITQKMH
jgi:hypothetical protein